MLRLSTASMSWPGCGAGLVSARLLEGKADVATLIFYNFEVIEALGRGARPGYFALKDWGIPDFCQLILITNEEVLFERRSLLRRVVRILRRGIDFLHEGARERLRAAGAEVSDGEERVHVLREVAANDLGHITGNGGVGHRPGA